MNDLQNIIGDYNAFLKQLLQELSDEGFELSDFVQMDHMCYRVASFESYTTKKQELSTVGTLLGEARVNGRPIATFRLHEPVFYENWRIDAIELPAPKEGVKTQEGLEHIEFVLFDDMKGFLKKYPDKQFDMRAAGRSINPEVSFKLPRYTVKFHLLNLPTAIYLQQKLGMNEI